MYLKKFTEIFLDNFCVYNLKEKHVECLEECFVQCEKYGIFINAIKSLLYLLANWLNTMSLAQSLAKT